jgi:hypothetical protein
MHKYRKQYTAPLKITNRLMTHQFHFWVHIPKELKVGIQSYISVHSSVTHDNQKAEAN